MQNHVLHKNRCIIDSMKKKLENSEWCSTLSGIKVPNLRLKKTKEERLNKREMESDPVLDKNGKPKGKPQKIGEIKL